MRGNILIETAHISWQELHRVSRNILQRVRGPLRSWRSNFKKHPWNNEVELQERNGLLIPGGWRRRMRQSSRKSCRAQGYD